MLESKTIYQRYDFCDFTTIDIWTL